MTRREEAGPKAHDLVDVRLLEAMREGGCPVCVVRSRAERGVVETIIRERVLDRGFRADLERREGFCRRHVVELVAADRRETGGILGASLLLAAIIDRRTTGLADTVGTGRRTVRSRVKAARVRPPCVACTNGATAAETARTRLAERAEHDDWAVALADSPLCLDDLLALWETAGSAKAFEPVARAQLARFGAIHDRLEAYAHHSSQDRRHLLTDEERTAADDATRALGGTRRADPS